MRLVFMGTPSFAAVCLNAVLETEHELVGVYTKPDTPKNRGMKLIPSEVKRLAQSHGLPIYQPVSLRDDAVYEELKALEPDLIIAVAYGKILPQRVLDIPPLGCVNIHGVTAMYMNAGMDEGDIIDVRRTKIGENETAGELMERLAPIGAALLKDTLAAISAGTVTRHPQDAALASYAPMLTKELSPVDWSRPARAILAQIRGLNPWPAATAVLGGVEFKLWEACPFESEVHAVPGTLLALTKKGLAVACGDGALLITRLQAPGGKAMPAADYFRGHPIEI